MFWRFGGYANISTIDTLLEKPDFTLENLLDEADLLHEIKQHNAKLIEYLREEPVLHQLLDYVVAPKLEAVAAPESAAAAGDDAQSAGGEDDKGKAAQFSNTRPRSSSLAASEPDEEDEGEKKRNRYAYVSSEVLSSDTWSIYEALMENGTLVREFWDFLKRPAPLDPLQASYFTKVNEALFEKKTEDMIEVLKSVPDAVSDLLRHVECPMIMDLLLKIIALDRTEGGQGIVEWLYSQDVVPILLSCLSPDRNWVVQTAAGDFIKAIITISANASQNEQQCIGPNELTRQLVSRDCIERLIKYMLAGGNPLTVGVGIVIEVIRKNNSDYDPDVGADEGSTPSCRDPIYLGTLLRLFAEHVPDFMRLIMHAPTTKQDIHSTFGNRIEPLGFDRFKTCELMAELLHCSNMGLMNEVGSEQLIAARDAERHRLRDDGKLVPRREEDPSMSGDDLTMRFSPPANQADSRRLEVTNVAEEDGFEEVEHSREMNEDTEHEFVKAEEEIPPPVPIPSFFDKDDDELMDEPLSSPRLQIKDEDLDAQQFEEPDMVVAPLSPKKKSAAPVVEAGGTSAEGQAKEETKPVESKVEGSKEEESKPQETKPEATKPEEDTKPENKDTAATAKEMTGSDEATAISDKETTASGEATTTTGEDSTAPDNAIKDTVPAPASAEEPRKEDDSDSSAVHTPGTTESQPEQEPESGSTESPAPEPKASETEPAKEEVKNPDDSRQEQTSSATPESPVAQEAEPTKSSTETNTEKTEAPSASAPTPAETSEGAAQPKQSDVNEEPADTKADERTEAEAGTESIVIGAESDARPKEGGATPLQPVVGDFLKTQFVEHMVIPTILSFFFRYPWNNFLHNVVYDVVQQVFNGPMDRGYNPNLAVSLFESADITNAIIEGQRRSDESQAKTKTRMGYMGHLTLIAEEVVKFTERHPPELLSETVLERVMSQEWVNYVEGALAETRERDNAILGGVRPEVAMNNRAAMSGLAGVGLSGLGQSLSLGNQGQSSALADAGLNGNLEMNEGGGSGMGPFAISAGTMMSGFGSSSDEEEDENEDTEEDINNEFRSYTDPLNNNGGSLDPPSIPPPPPPPPLNIPPSRARLQLAARLAMHQKNAAAAAAVAPPEGTRDAEDEDEDDRHGGSSPRNPFGDDADEVESDDEGAGGSWGAGRGGWWRDVVMKRENLSDSDDEVDEEFGDFAMPEAEGGSGGGASGGQGTQGTAGLRVVKPLAVHPAGQKTGFGSLWPFSAHNFGRAEEKKEEAGEGGEKKDDKEREGKGGEEGEGKGISRTVEAKTRTSLDDDEEVVV